jgi:hypothetical protein
MFSSETANYRRFFNAIMLGNNGEISSGDGQPRAFLKNLQWQKLEKHGDLQIRWITQRELPKIVGQKNYDLCSIVEDHENSNKFFEAVTKHYNLDTRVKNPPRHWMKHQIKLGADIFEAWVGGHVYERMQYDDKDPLYELRYFFNRLWSIRYRALNLYHHNPTLNHVYIPSGVVQGATISEVECKSNSILENTLGCFLGAPNYINPKLGYCVEVETTRDPDDFYTVDKIPGVDSKIHTSTSHTSFATSELEVRQMAELRLWTIPGSSFHYL